MSFTLPTKTEWMKKQMEHEATRQYAEDIYKLTKKFKPAKALEVGCMWGVSTLSILTGGAEHLTSVDKSSFTHAGEETEENNFRYKWTFINMPSHDYWQGVSNEFDFVYIDGDHHYDYVKEDLFEGWKRVKDGGILAIDDVMHPNNKETNPEKAYGVSLATWELTHSINRSPKFCGKILWFKK